MRSRSWARGRCWVAGVLAAGLAMQAFGCIFTVPECLHCGEQAAGGGGGGTPAGCVPSESAETAVADSCGVFVARDGNDGAAGTKAEPVATLSEAIARAAERGTRVYACAETFEQNVEVPAGVRIFGGLDCANGWGWVGETTKTTVAGPADAIAMKLLGGEGTTRIEDVAVRAADATVASGSSIAVLVDGATAELERCELTAGDGMDGLDGVDAPSAPPEQAPAGSNGTNACSDVDLTPGPDTTLPGGAQVVEDCEGEQSIGGKGGDGNVPNGGAGQQGETGTLGAPGAGEPAAGAWDCAATGTGQGGSAGTPGDPGTAASGLGTLSSTGYTGASGGPGTPGKAGQGGGGGGGAKGGNAICPGGVPGAGASGGSGGAGGCGGAPGAGGGRGGASIALASVQATVTLTDCTLTAGNGGNGGPGGDFQPGADGGSGGTGGTGAGGSKTACDGGKGGQGGNGGPGGGGLGGHSVAVAFTGTAPAKIGTTVLTPGTSGTGGPGGSNNTAANAGADGTAAEELELP